MRASVVDTQLRVARFCGGSVPARASGEIVDVHGGSPNWTANCPRHPEQNAGC